MQNKFVKSALLIVPFVLLAAASPARAATNEESTVRAYFADIPVMAEIARCESKFRQFTDSGNVLRGGASGGMIGVFQFYESIHAPAAAALGYDLATLEGNMAYARHVYNTQSTTPWNSARYCWENVVITTQAAPTTGTTMTRAEMLEKIELLTKLIALLETQLKSQQLS